MVRGVREGNKGWTYYLWAGKGKMGVGVRGVGVRGGGVAVGLNRQSYSIERVFW